MAKVTIWKYPLTPDRAPQCIEMQDGAEVLRVGGQRDRVYLWAKVNPNAFKHTRTFLVIGTGWEFDDNNTRYVGSAIVVDDRYVWHVYEVVP